MNPINWIGVTGMGRSGTTFLGAALAIPPRVGYLHEPFNPCCGIRGVDWSAPHLLDDNLSPEELASRAIDKILRLRGSLTHYAPRSDAPWRRLAKRLVGSRGPVELLKAKLTPGITHAVLKDPVGFYLFPHLSEKHRVRNLVVVKHPVAAVAGHDRVGWHDGIEFLRKRPYLRPHLTATEIAGLDLSHASSTELLAWQWRITYGFLLRQARDRDWHVVKIEDLSQNPVEQIHGLYERFGLPWSSDCAKRISRLTSEKNQPNARGDRVQDLARDSRKVFERQRDRVSPEDRRRVFDITFDLASDLYDESSYDLR